VGEVHRWNMYNYYKLREWRLCNSSWR